MASKIKVDEIETVDGTGSITVNQPLSGSGAGLTSLPAANLTGSLPTSILPAAGTSGNVLTSTGSAWNSAALASSGFTLKGAPVATTSGANIDISGFPAGISMMVVGFMGISCESTVDMQFQMGTASGLPANVYSWSVSAELRGSSYPDMIDSNSSFPINANWHGHTFVYDGQMIITRMSTSNAWTASWNVSASKSSYFQLSAGAGKISDLGGEFTQIRLRNGGHNFDAGSVNFAYLL